MMDSRWRVTVDMMVCEPVGSVWTGGEPRSRGEPPMVWHWCWACFANRSGTWWKWPRSTWTASGRASARGNRATSPSPTSGCWSISRPTTRAEENRADASRLPRLSARLWGEEAPHIRVHELIWTRICWVCQQETLWTEVLLSFWWTEFKQRSDWCWWVCIILLARWTTASPEWNEKFVCIWINGGVYVDFNIYYQDADNSQFSRSAVSGRMNRFLSLQISSCNLLRTEF